MGQNDPIVPRRADIEVWRLHAESAIEFSDVRLGEFNWPQAVLSLIAEWERHNGTDRR